MTLALTVNPVSDHGAQLVFEQIAAILGNGPVGDVLTADVHGNASWAAIPLPGTPVDVSGSRVLGTAYQPSATRPVFVNATVFVESASNVPSAIALLVGATSSPATQLNVAYVLATSGTVEMFRDLSVLLPAGWYYELSVIAFGATQGISKVFETVL
jgi:hypothetical protein